MPKPKKKLVCVKYLQDLEDLAEIAHNFCKVGRCSGGRLIPKDYICNFCGSQEPFEEGGCELKKKG